MTITIKDVLVPSRIIDVENNTTTKQLLTTISDIFAKNIPDENANDIFLKLIARERLGSTNIGYGIALPHTRLSQCPRAIATLVRTQAPISFHPMDEEPVDLFFALAVPENANEDHLKLLASIAEMFHDSSFRSKIREATDSNEIYELMIEQDEREYENH